MDWIVFIKATVLGFSIAAPIGAIGVLCIRRTLSGGFWSGFISGLGAATADAVYGCIAVFSLAIVSAFLVNSRTYLQLSGGIFLLYLGCRILFSAAPKTLVGTQANKNLLTAYVSTFFLTLTNPMTILSFTALFTASAPQLPTAGSPGGLLIAGVFTGSMIWWCILSTLAAAVRETFNCNRLTWVQRLSGIIIMAFGMRCIFTLR